jgi:hypothetical protein
MTLEDLVAELYRSGLRLNNLFQLQDGTWRCNVRSNNEAHGWNYFDAETPSAAVRGAILKASTEAAHLMRKNQPRAVRERTMIEAKSGTDLLNLLGL